MSYKLETPPHNSQRQLQIMDYSLFQFRPSGVILLLATITPLGLKYIVRCKHDDLKFINY